MGPLLQVEGGSVRARAQYSHRVGAEIGGRANLDPHELADVSHGSLLFVRSIAASGRLRPVRLADGKAHTDLSAVRYASIICGSGISLKKNRSRAATNIPAHGSARTA